MKSSDLENPKMCILARSSLSLSCVNFRKGSLIEGGSFLFCKVTTDGEPTGCYACYESYLKGRQEIIEAEYFLKLLVWKEISRVAIDSKQKSVRMPFTI